MSRDVKRVALDFDWPLNKTWEGFLRPEGLEGIRCPECDGSGQTDAGWWLQNFSSRLSMLVSDVADQEKGKPMHPWLAEDVYPHGIWENDEHGQKTFKVKRPSADIVDLFAGLTGRSPEELKSPFGRESYAIYRILAEASGVESWGICKACTDGRTEAYEGQFKERDEWRPAEPPAGEGWQLWESVSEGSPISPVCKTREAFIEWLTSPMNHRDGPMSKEYAERFVDAGWAPTFAFSVGKQ